jgi:hypothetical protein
MTDTFWAGVPPDFGATDIYAFSSAFVLNSRPLDSREFIQNLYLLSLLLKSCTPNHRKGPKTPRKQDFHFYPSELNQSDTYNHDHGDNTVEVFQVITQAMKEKQGASSADQLEDASQLLRQKTQSGSGQAYASGLERAAQALIGQTVNKDTAGTLIKSLLGADTVSAPAAPTGGDLLGSLVSSLTGGGGQAGAAPGGSDRLDMGDLLNAGMSYMAAKKAGKGGLEALMGAVVNSSAIGQGGRGESGTLVANALLSALSKVK